MKLGFFLGFINSHIILGLVFYIMLIPIAIIMKLIGYDPLKKNLNGLNSFKEYRQSNKIDLTRIF